MSVSGRKRGQRPETEAETEGVVAKKPKVDKGKTRAGSEDESESEEEEVAAQVKKRVAVRPAEAESESEEFVTSEEFRAEVVAGLKKVTEAVDRLVAATLKQAKATSRQANVMAIWGRRIAEKAGWEDEQTVIAKALAAASKSGGGSGAEGGDEAGEEPSGDVPMAS